MLRGFAAWPVFQLIETHGLQAFDDSLAALAKITHLFSAEFAVRPYIATDPKRAFRILSRWTGDGSEHVRRLASEGSRPRLPWGMRLNALVRDPEPCAVILEALKDDESLFVRRSVANHLNDITKDHPEWVLQRLESWDLDKPDLAWIARHACRTLIKRGHPRALKLFGFGQKAAITATMQLSSRSLCLGERLGIEVELVSTATRQQRLAVDYVIHYVKARGAAFEKVFKWTELDLPARATVVLTKTQVIRDFTTRKHHAGHHVVELQINGQRVAHAGFDLKT